MATGEKKTKRGDASPSKRPNVGKSKTSKQTTKADRGSGRSSRGSSGSGSREEGSSA